MNKKRTLFVVTTLVVVALMLVGSAVPRTVVAQGNAITVSYMESGTYDKAAEALASEFEKETGVKVSVAAFPWAVLRQNNTNDLLAGTALYDVMSGGYYLADVYDKFAPLGDLIAADKFGEGMIPGLMDPGRSEYFNGKQIGVPYGVDSYGLMVNNEILQGAGVEPTFATWQEFLDACKTITEKMPDVACFSHSTGNPEQIGAFFFSGYDGTYVDKDGKYALEVEKATAVMKLLPELWKYLPPNSAALSFDEAHQVFMDGKAAMLVTWPSFVSTALDNKETSKVYGKWSQVNFPGPGFPWLSLWQLFIPQQSKNQEAAWKWIKAFAGESNGTRFYKEYGINSVWLSTYQDAELAELHKHQWPAMLEGFSRAKNPPLSGEAQDFLTNTCVQVATGQVTPEGAVRLINEKWATIPVPAALLETATLAGMRAK